MLGAEVLHQAERGGKENKRGLVHRDTGQCEEQEKIKNRIGSYDARCEELLRTLAPFEREKGRQKSYKVCYTKSQAVM